MGFNSGFKGLNKNQFNTGIPSSSVNRLRRQTTQYLFIKCRVRLKFVFI
jgi:hypothetical protein